jgi:hypothetical protein
VSYDRRTETTVRTFRLNKEWDTILKEEAEKQSISVSSLLNQIVRRYTVAQRFFNHSQTVSVDYKIFSPILELLSEEQITDFGRVVGSISVREGITKRGLPMEFESVEYLILEIYDRYSGWFKSNTYKNGTNYVINLNHVFGRKWSLFVSSFMESMLQTLLEISIRPEIYDNSVILRIPTRQINKR